MSDTPRTDALMAKWDDDGATRGPAFRELRDLARQLERTPMNHDDLGNYSRTYVEGLKRENDGMKAQITQQNAELEALKRQIREMAGTPKPGDEQ